MTKKETDELAKFGHVDLLFPSNYAKAADLLGRTVTVVIDRIVPREKLQMAGGRKDEKPVIYMRGKKKGWILNKTNAKAIAKVYGPELMSWIGKAVAIKSMSVEAKGEMVDAIRVDVDATRRFMNQASPGVSYESEPAHDESTGEVADDESPAHVDTDKAWDDQANGAA